MTCEWPVDRTCLPPLPEIGDPDNPDANYLAKAEQQNHACDMAVQVLWALSGRQFGACSAVARPCHERGNQMRFTGMSWEPFVPVFWGGAWLTIGCGCEDRCERVGPNVVHLPGPVQSVETVTLGTVELDPSGYVLEGDVLYRLGGNWPQQNMSQPLGQEGTWSVEYTRGWPPPQGSAGFVGLLAKEFLAACNDTKCRLPRNVVGVNRNGVSYQIYDPSSLMRSGKTGLSEIDLWLAAINPYALTAAPTVI